MVPYATILAPRGSKGGPGSILGGISVSFGSHFESLGASSALFFCMFFKCFFESIFGGVLFGPGPDFEWFWDTFWSPLGAIFCHFDDFCWIRRPLVFEQHYGGLGMFHVSGAPPNRPRGHRSAHQNRGKHFQGMCHLKYTKASILGALSYTILAIRTRLWPYGKVFTKKLQN